MSGQRDEVNRRIARRYFMLPNLVGDSKEKYNENNRNKLKLTGYVLFARFSISTSCGVYFDSTTSNYIHGNMQTQTYTHTHIWNQGHNFLPKCIPYYSYISFDKIIDGYSENITLRLITIVYSRRKFIPISSKKSHLFSVMKYFEQPHSKVHDIKYSVCLTLSDLL